MARRVSRTLHLSVSLNASNSPLSVQGTIARALNRTLVDAFTAPQDEVNTCKIGRSLKQVNLLLILMADKLQSLNVMLALLQIQLDLPAMPMLPTCPNEFETGNQKAPLTIGNGHDIVEVRVNTMNEGVVQELMVVLGSIA